MRADGILLQAGMSNGDVETALNVFRICVWNLMESKSLGSDRAKWEGISRCPQKT